MSLSPFLFSELSITQEDNTRLEGYFLTLKSISVQVHPDPDCTKSTENHQKSNKWQFDVFVPLVIIIPSEISESNLPSKAITDFFF